MVRLLIIFVFILVASCSTSNYQFGDISKQYCTTENKEIRAVLKAALIKNNVVIGVDYCTVRGFAAAVAK